MTTNYHLCIDINGVLRQTGREFAKNFKGVMKDSAGRLMSVAEVRVEFEQAQARGWKVMPTTECDNFDYQTGCKGHPEDKS